MRPDERGEDPRDEAGGEGDEDREGADEQNPPIDGGHREGESDVARLERRGERWSNGEPSGRGRLPGARRAIGFGHLTDVGSRPAAAQALVTPREKRSASSELYREG